MYKLNTNGSLGPHAKVMYKTCAKVLYFPRPLGSASRMRLYIGGEGNHTGQCLECDVICTLPGIYTEGGPWVFTN